MARMMYVDDNLYRLRDVDGTWAYGPYTKIGTARAMKTRLQNRSKQWGRASNEYVVEKVTAGDYTDAIWEKVS